MWFPTGWKRVICLGQGGKDNSIAYQLQPLVSLSHEGHFTLHGLFRISSQFKAGHCRIALGIPPLVWRFSAGKLQFIISRGLKIGWRLKNFLMVAKIWMPFACVGLWCWITWVFWVLLEAEFVNLEHLEQIKREECSEMMKISSRLAKFAVSLIGWSENNAQIKLKANSDMDSHKNTVQCKRRIQNYLPHDRSSH